MQLILFKATDMINNDRRPNVSNLLVLLPVTVWKKVVTCGCKCRDGALRKDPDAYLYSAHGGRAYRHNKREAWRRSLELPAREIKTALPVGCY